MLCKNCKVVKVVIILCLMNTFRIQVFQKMEMTDTTVTVFFVFFNLEKMENTELFRINLICGLSTLLSCLITQTKHNYIYTTFILLFTLFPARCGLKSWNVCISKFLASVFRAYFDRQAQGQEIYNILKKCFTFLTSFFVCACAFVYVWQSNFQSE